MTALPPEHPANRNEQNKIVNVVLAVIPDDVYYRNLIIAFTDMLSGFAKGSFKSNVYSKSTETEHKERQTETKENEVEENLQQINDIICRLPPAEREIILWRLKDNYF